MEVNAAKKMQPCLLCYDMEETDKDTLLDILNSAWPSC